MCEQTLTLGESDMARRTLIAIASLVSVIAAAQSAADPALAAEPYIAGMHLSSSDATAIFMPLGINKSVVIDLPRDINDVLVTDPKTANAVVRSKRRVFIIGVALGQTNVYFFDADGRQIGALDVAVVNGSPRSPSENNPSALPANVVVVYRGASGVTYSCTPYTCVGADKPDTTAYSQITTISK
jgi:Flp pilus assembly secretin CpaC